MIELHDGAGRLIVVLPMSMKHYGRVVCVYINGRSVAEFRTCRETLAYARSVELQGESETLEPPSSLEEVAVE